MFQQQRTERAGWRPALIAAGIVASAATQTTAQLVSFVGEPACMASTMAGGSYADGEGWYIEDPGVIETGPLSITAQTAAALPDGLVSGHAHVTVRMSGNVVSLNSDAHAFVGPGMVVETFSTAASVVVRLQITQDTPFFIRRSGSLPALFTPVTGVIDGATLRAGTYDLAGAAWASRRYPGSLNLAGSFTLVLADCVPDWNDDGEIGSADISAYLADWIEDASQGGTRTDINADGNISSSDITAYLGLWLPASLHGC